MRRRGGASIKSRQGGGVCFVLGESGTVLTECRESAGVNRTTILIHEDTALGLIIVS